MIDSTSLAANEDISRQITAFVKPQARTLETGCGITTVAFAMCGCQHLCVTPSADEAERVTAFCREHGIDPGSIKFAIGSSAESLPALVTAGPLDMVFIDGAHRFPYPVIDFHYTECRLRVGGFMVVDDVRIPSVRVLYEFLCTESE